MRVMYHSNTDEIPVSHSARRRIEIDPARTWNINLDPSVGVATGNWIPVFLIPLLG